MDRRLTNPGFRDIMPANGRNAPPRPDLAVAQGRPREPNPTGLWMVGLVAVLVILLLFFAAIL